MYRRFGTRLNSICLVAASTSLFCSCLGYSQTQSKAATMINDAQAQVLMMQMLTAQGTAGGPSLSAAQTQMLMEYMQAKNASAGLVGNGAAQTQLMMQSLAAQARRLPGASGAAAAIPSGLATSAPAATPAAPVASTSLGEKKPGVIRIGITMPKAQLGPSAQGPTAGEPLRSMLQQYLAGPSVEVTLIAALLPDQMEAEGKSKQCDFLLYSSISQKKQSGGMGMLRNASSYANMIPMIGMANGLGGAIAAASAASAVSQAATLSSSVKAKSDVVLEYHLNSVGSPSPELSKTLNAKAATDGEDVITPLVEQEATSIMAEVGKKR